MRCHNPKHEDGYQWTSRASNDGPPDSCPSCSGTNVSHTGWEAAENPNPGAKKYNCPEGDYSTNSKASYWSHRESTGH